MPLPNDQYMLHKAIWDGYEAARGKNGLSIRIVKYFKNDYKVMLEAKREAMEANGQKEDLLYGQYAFMGQMLDRGWTVGDMEFMSELYEMIQGNTLYEKQGQDMLKLLRETEFETLERRVMLLRQIRNYLEECGKDNPLTAPLLSKLQKIGNTNFNFGEYPHDEEMGQIAEKAGDFNPKVIVEKGKELPIRQALLMDSKYYNALEEEEKQKVRNRGTYVMNQMNEEEIVGVPLNRGQKKRGIEVTNRQAIQSVYGSEVYDEIDEKHQGTEEERSIHIHNAVGSRLQRQGTTVLEFDLAGSGYFMARREYSGQHGKLNPKTESGKQQLRQMDKQYGLQLRDANGKLYEGIRKKSKDVTLSDGKTYNKTRYTISGPGLLNIGDHSIENNRVYVRDLAKNEILKYFEAWTKDPSLAHDINIRLSGHSRGAVAAEEGARYIQNWLKDYAQKHKEVEPFLKHIQYDLSQRDAVPGFGTFLRLGKRDLRKIPNMNATVFCTMAQDHPDMLFPLQNIRGARRIIVGTMEHGMDLGSIDLSQMRYEDDGKAHQSGFYDAGTGEFYRGSGLSELPDGVYIADERYNLIRLTSYSQIEKLVDQVYASAPKQKSRVNTIHDMVRNWFIDNELSISFQSETERENAQDQAFDAMGKLMKSKASRLREVQKQIRRLDELRMSNADPKELKAQNEVLIQACKKYMKKTSIPAKGDSAYRMNLVSDVLAFAQRENNYITWGLDRNRIPQKEGYAERQLDRERKRLDREIALQDTFFDVKKHCQEVVEKLKKTRIGKANSSEYDRFFAAVKRGALLNENTSPEFFHKVMHEIQASAVEYDILHGDALTGDGMIRDHEAKEMAKYARKMGKLAETLGNGIARKDNSIDDIIQNREMRIQHLEDQIRSEGGVLTDALKTQKRLDEAIRIESARFNRLKKQPLDPQGLGVNSLEFSAAKLVYLQTIKEAAAKNGYQNPKQYIKAVSDSSHLLMAVKPLMEKKGFSEMVKATSVRNLKEGFQSLGKQQHHAVVL